MAKKNSTTASDTATEEQKVMATENSSILVDDTDDENSFTFDSSLEDATAPEPLPAGEYLGRVTQMKKTIGRLNGKPQAAMTVIFDPDQFPADYPIENAPDGKVMVYYSKDLSKDKNGKWNARQLAEAFGAPLGNKISPDDYLEKVAKWDVDVVELNDGSGMKVNRIKNPPRRA